MTKRLPTPQPEETVTIPKATFENIFKCLEEMKAEIVALRKRLEPIQQQERLLSVAEAAEFVGVKRQTISAYRRQGKITKVLRGGKSGYLESDLTKVKKK